MIKKKITVFIKKDFKLLINFILTTPNLVFTGFCLEAGFYLGWHTVIDLVALKQ